MMPFTTVFELKVVQSEDEPNEQYFIYTPGDIDEKVITRLAEAGRILDRLHLYEIPFLVIYSAKDVRDAHHMGWGIYIPNMEQWEFMLKAEDRDIILCNGIGHETVLSEASDEYIYLLDAEKVSKLHFEYNVHVYYIKV